MNALKIRVAFFATLAIAAFSPRSNAQDVGMLGQVTVPFAFETATGQHFQAGVYTFRMENSHILMINGLPGRGLAMATAMDDANPAKKSQVTFRKYGSDYFLAAITIAGKSRRLLLQGSKLEKRQQVAEVRQVPMGIAGGSPGLS